MSTQPFNLLTLPLDGQRLIEASAGTGKTFSLAGLFLRLLIEKRLDVSEILVITFTRAATQELRDRIRQRLTDAARRAGAPQPGAAQSPEDEITDALLAAGDEPRTQIARRLADAALRMDEAAIFTIHGFAQRAVADHAFESGLPFDRGEQVDDAPVFEEVTADYWRAQCIGRAGPPHFAEWWPTPAALFKALSDLRTRPHTRIWGPDAAAIGALSEQLRARWPEEGASFLRELETVFNTPKMLKAEGLKRALAQYPAFEAAERALTDSLAAPVDPAPLPVWTGYLRDAATEFFKKERAAGEAFFGKPLPRLLSRLQPLIRLQALRDAQQAISRAAAERKQLRRQFSFADMIGALDLALASDAGGEALARALHDSYPWALVDEFQDTDPLQYRILQRIYHRPDAGGLFLIGDPKQAIYSFRGGDVFAYLQAARHRAGARYGLDRNFRSTPALIRAVETLFRAPESQAFLVEGIEYQTVQAGKPAGRTLHIGQQALAPITCWPLPTDCSKKPEAEAACQAGCVEQIRRMLQPDEPARIRRVDADGTAEERPVRPRDIAVLVNKNDQAAEVQRALSRVGIPAVCVHQQSVLTTDEAEELRRILRAMHAATDEALIRGALLTQLMGVTLDSLTSADQDENVWQARIDTFQRAQQTWRERGVLAVVQPLVQDAAPRLLGFEDGERRLSNYLQLAELLASGEAESFGTGGLLSWLQNGMQRAADGETADAEQLRLESDEALVRIVTVHKSKGLEYPIVFMPFAPWLGTFGQPDKPPFRFHDEAGESVFDPLGDDANAEASVREARAEGIRLLYVAMTRAELSVFFPWGACNGVANSALASLLHRADDVDPAGWWASNSAGPLDHAATNARLEALSAESKGGIEVAALPVTQGNTVRAPAPPATTVGARTDLPGPYRPWSMFSFTGLLRTAAPAPALAGAADEMPVAEDAPDNPVRSLDRLPDLPGGTGFGSAIHAVLETARPTDWPADGAITDFEYAQTAECLRQYGLVLPDDAHTRRMIEHCVQLVRRTLHSPIPTLGPLAAIPPERQRVEMEFMFRLGGSDLKALLSLLRAHGYGPEHPQGSATLRGLMHGFIDLVVQQDECFHVIDYKTNRIGPGANDYAAANLQQAMRSHHYDLQYLIYQLALHRHLRQRLPAYDPTRQLGDVFYLFLRGMSEDQPGRGIFHDKPPLELIEQMDQLLDARETP